MFEILSFSQGLALATIGLIPMILMLVTKKTGLKLQVLSVLGAFTGAFGLANALDAFLLS